jgi:hypothetical protein
MQNYDRGGGRKLERTEKKLKIPIFFVRAQ